MFLSRNKKNNVYPCKPQFYYIKVGFKRSTLYRHVFVMGEPYAVPFISAKKHAIVSLNVYMTIFSMLNTVYQICQFSYFCEFPKVCKVFGEEYILSEVFENIFSCKVMEQTKFHT